MKCWLVVTYIWRWNFLGFFFQIDFVKKCGLDDICQSNLELQMSLKPLEKWVFFFGNRHMYCPHFLYYCKILCMYSIWINLNSNDISKSFDIHHAFLSKIQLKSIQCQVFHRKMSWICLCYIYMLALWVFLRLFHIYLICNFWIQLFWAPLMNINLFRSYKITFF